MSWKVVLLVIWILFTIDSTYALASKLIPVVGNWCSSASCPTWARMFPVVRKIGLDTPWVYVYFVLAVFGLITAIEVKKQECSEDKKQTSKDVLHNPGMGIPQNM